jgi:hypothetical protein
VKKLWLLSFFLLAAPVSAKVDTMLTFPGGADGEVQYNCDYLFCAETGFSYNATTNVLTVSSASLSYISFSTGTVSQIRWADGTVQVSSPSASGGGTSLSTGSAVSGGDPFSVLFVGADGTLSTDVDLYFSTSSNLLTVPAFYAANGAQFGGGISLSAGSLTVASGNQVFLSNGSSLDTSTGAPAGLLGVVTATNTGNAFGGNGSLLTALTAASISSGNLGAGVVASSIAASAVGIQQHSATGSPSGTTYLRGDNTWATISAGGVTIGNAVSGGSVSGGLLFEDSSFNVAQSTRFYVEDGSNLPRFYVSASTVSTQPQIHLFNASTGDAGIRFSVSARSWMMGIDNDDSDTLEFDTAASTSATISASVPPFRLTSSGDLAVASSLMAGNTSACVSGASILSCSASATLNGFGYYGNNTSAYFLRFVKSRSGTVGTGAVVAVGDNLGGFEFYAHKDGGSALQAASIVVTVKALSATNTRAQGDMAFKVAQATNTGTMDTALYISTNGTTGVGLNNTAPEPSFALDISGRFGVKGSTPTASSCGTSPSVVGSDAAGKVTIGSSASDTCTLTFSVAYPVAPACVVIGEDSAITLGATTSTTVLTITAPGATDFSSDVISYICIGQDGN